MSWRTLTTTAGARLPAELLLDGRAGATREPAGLVGPALHGWTYRARGGSTWYRVVPIDDSVPLSWRQAVRGRVRPAAAGANVSVAAGSSLAPITAVEQLPDVGDPPVPWLAVRYELGSGVVSLAEWLVRPEPSERLGLIARLLRAMPGWWRELGRPLLPTAADVAVTPQGEPLLLGLPSLRPPPIGALLAEPTRVLAMAPEVLGVRGGLVDWRSDRTWEAVDRYALAVLLARCFSPPPAWDDAEELLPRAASGSVFPGLLDHDVTPFWLARVPATDRARPWVLRLAAHDPRERARVDVVQAADALAACAERMRPAQAVTEVRGFFGGPLKALQLLRDVLLTGESYDLLVLGGDIAAEHAAQPLEGLAFYERAAALDPARSEAYERQFELLSQPRKNPTLGELLSQHDFTSLQLDARVWRDFLELPPGLQLRHEERMAHYLNWRSLLPQWRGELDKVAQFIHGRLVDGSGVFHWYKVGLNLEYAMTLFVQALRLSSDGDAGRARERLTAADAQRQIVRQGLATLARKDLLDPGEHDELGERLNELDVMCFDLRQELGVP